MQLDNVEDMYPLSPMQQGMIFHTLYDQETGAYFQQLVYTLEGAVDGAALGRAWQRVVERHPALRSAFVWQSLDTPLQVVRQQAPMPWAEHDWRGEPPERQRQRLDELLAEQHRSGLALDSSPLMNATLVRTADDRAWLIWNHHHIILDAWSTAIVLGEVFALYAGQPLKPAPPFRDYIAWLQQQDLVEAEGYWRGLLAGFPAATPLPYDDAPGQRPAKSAVWANQSLELSEALSGALRTLAQQQRLTLNTLVRGAWALLLSRHSGGEDVVFGSTTSGRPADLPGVEAIVGLFINTMPVRVRADADAELLPWLHAIQAEQIRQERYAYSPLVALQGWSEVPRGQPLFESLLVFENAPASSAARIAQSGLSISDIRYSGHTSFPLTVEVAPGAGLFFNIQYDTGRFEAAAVARLLEQLQTLLGAMAENPHRRLAELPWMSPDERRRILVDWNATASAPATVCTHQLFAAQVACTPERVALVCDGAQLTYAELDRRANQLAHHLRQQGVGPEVLVGLCADRTPAMLVALLGILKAGGAYVPLDPAYPAQRIALMLEDARVAVLVMATKEPVELPAGAALVDLERDQTAIAACPETPPANQAGPDNLAYVIYTSGSTGRPKGVQISHAALANLLASIAEQPGLRPGDTLLSVTTLSFDIATLELFLPLISGVRLELAPRDVAVDGRRLAALIASSGATVMLATPTTWSMLLASGWTGAPDLRIWCSGEALPLDLARRLAGCCAELWNMYGPTETTIWSTMGLVVPDAPRVTIGRPIRNTQIYILDQRMQPVPVGVPGELYIGGDGLARGYLNRPELTAERFIFFDEGAEGWGLGAGEPDSDNSKLKTQNSKLYRTGDIARWLPDGTIECLGRGDDQVKLRGHRIELGEIEAALRGHPLVAQAVVALREDTPGDQRLVAYLVAAEERRTKNGEPDSEDVERKTQHVKRNTPDEENSKLKTQNSDLRAFLARQLPAYMLPAAYVWLGALPLTPNGKIDRRALPAPGADWRAAGPGFVAPRTFVEEQLAAIWRDLLRIDQIGVEDSFFALGGHSLLLMQLASQIQEVFEVALPLRVLFDRPTVAEMGRAVAERMVEQIDPAEFDELLNTIEALSPEELQALLQAGTENAQ
ncbi:MAG TPA: amino acid adenylation domain-containing protein [Roseiflexaceae bacterium]|nr:amino acid adenylation domain-containing protein [Roseiflexaceae bacterium]